MLPLYSLEILALCKERKASNKHLFLVDYRNIHGHQLLEEENQVLFISVFPAINRVLAHSWHSISVRGMKEREIKKARLIDSNNRDSFKNHWVI